MSSIIITLTEEEATALRVAARARLELYSPTGTMFPLVTSACAIIDRALNLLHAEEDAVLLAAEQSHRQALEAHMEGAST